VKKSLIYIYPFLHPNHSILIAYLQISYKKIVFLDIKNIEGAFIPPFPRQVTSMPTEKLVIMNMAEKNVLWSHFPTITPTLVTFAELHGVAVRNEVPMSFRNVKSLRLRTYFINVTLVSASAVKLAAAGAVAAPSDDHLLH